MHRLLQLALLALVSVATAAPTSEDCDPELSDISSNVFGYWNGDDWHPDDEPRDLHILTYFYTPWSDDCPSLSPLLEQAASYHSANDSIFFTKFDCGKWPKDCERHGVRHDPTLREWRGIPSSFESFTTRAAIMTKLSEMTQGAVSAVTLEQTSPWTMHSDMVMRRPRTKAPSNEIYLPANGSNTEAVLKMALPGAPFDIDIEKYPEAKGPSAVVLHFQMSANGHHLILNNYHHMALAVPNPSTPPLISASQVGEQRRMGDLLLSQALFLGPGRKIKLDYELDVEPRENINIRYYNHTPTLRLNLIGAGTGFYSETKSNFLLDDPSQKIVEIQMQEQNGLHSQHPDRNYTIVGVRLLDRPATYKSPDPRDATPCSFLSWRCGDFSDPPYYRRIWRFQFDEDGRIGSLRWTCVRMWFFMRLVVLYVLCPAWFAFIAWKVLRVMSRKKRVDLDKPLPVLPFERKKGYL